MKKKSLSCFVCGRRFDTWMLIGGGYDDNIYAAVLRESLPVVTCEVCFRKCFYGDNEVEEVGIAVLPDVIRRTNRSIEIEKYLFNRKRSCTDQCFNPSEQLSSAEITCLLKEKRIFRAIDIDVELGTVQLLYSFAEIPNEGLYLFVADPPENRLSDDLLIEVFCLTSRLRCRHPVRDFFWLYDRLSREVYNVYKELPLISRNYTGSLSTVADIAYTNLQISNLEQFLRFVCVVNPYCQSPTLHSFFRSGFAIARALIEVEDEENAEFRSFGARVSQKSDQLRLISQSIKKISKITNSVHALTESIRNEMISTCDREKHFVGNRLFSTVSFQELNIESIEGFVNSQIACVQEEQKQWIHVNDFLHA
jgi:hypothetical protein